MSIGRAKRLPSRLPRPPWLLLCHVKPELLPPLPSLHLTVPTHPRYPTSVTYTNAHNKTPTYPNPLPPGVLFTNPYIGRCVVWCLNGWCFLSFGISEYRSVSEKSNSLIFCLNLSLSGLVCFLHLFCILVFIYFYIVRYNNPTETSFVDEHQLLKKRVCSDLLVLISSHGSASPACLVSPHRLNRLAVL